jgi:hypothetical protein
METWRAFVWEWIDGSVAEGLIDLLARLLGRAFRIDGVFDVFRGAI